jgi:uncharacterized protein YaiE (UPF0345 family)
MSPGAEFNIDQPGVGGGTFKINSSGNVGIGTASPSQRLHVANAAGGVVAFLQSTATNGEPSLNLEGRNSSGTVRSAVFKYDNADILRIGTSSPIDFRFETNDVERMRITSTGTLEFLGTATGLAGAYFTNDNTSLKIHSTFGGGTTKDLILQSGGSPGAPQLILKAGGNVGIGTTSPESPLHIAGKQNNAKSGGGGAYKQTVVGQTTAAASGVSKKIAYVGFTHAVRVYVWARQSDDNGSTAIADICTVYGATSGGVVFERNFGNVTNIDITYNNGGNPEYTIDVVVTYSGTAPTINFVVEGISDQNQMSVL